MDDHKILKNKANFTDTAERITCDNCANPLIFAIQDNYHEFSLDLITVLKCLYIAENEGAVPILPDSWWLEIRKSYKL